jgi:hypothetical protein
MSAEFSFFDKNLFYIKWTERLIAEYKSICYAHSLYLTRPVIRIQSLSHMWGYFDPEHKVISINEKLILNYNWETVCMVLKHEMAHQIAFEVLTPSYSNSSSKSNPHGDLFQRACDLLALPQEYRKAAFHLETPIPHWKDVKSEDDDLKRKIEKLLNLSQSSNEHEAALAMEKAQALYEKHHIDAIKSSKHQNYVSLLIDFKKRKTPSLALHISNILQNHFFVDTVFSSTYNAHTIKKRKQSFF